MTIHTALCETVGIEHPIVQAPIGSATTPELAAAVSNAGGLGHLAVTWRDIAETSRLIRETRERTDEPFAVNLALDDRTTIVDTDDHLEAILDASPDVVTFSFGDAAPYVDWVHDAGALAFQTVGSAAAARKAVDAGIDVVVTQGLEAGGHVQSEVATTALVPPVADAVGDDVPIVAAGGIADGRGIAAALALGADGAWLGTRFVATTQASVHETYRERVIESDETDTRYTTLYDKGWPGMPHRMLENGTLERWDAAGQPEPGERPGEDDVVATTESGKPIERYDEALATPDVDGAIEEMALYAGQSGGVVEETLPAEEVLEVLVTELRETVSDLESRVVSDPDA
ncbi:nitronate monooxygenase [Natrialba sp. INN-245]|uniref:NAD(P)H-dependent flavin oxidoreductase n=1 Tax=Natrialba sp. INN-245 TaxID=2690967 RepID=UPI001310CF6B|nr:nitronate monooxygenase [Natrialba sp. INN-245]MWV39743.1 nitronate monooxygenase [Natrialba sp. INN-245]